MIRGIRPHKSGFTIIEVIIFLSVSMALVLGSVILFNTRIPRTQFSQGVNDLVSKISDTGDNVANGSFSDSSKVSCSGGVASQDPTTAQEQGTNAGCLFLGRAMQFAPGPPCHTPPDDSCNQIDTYTVYGSRLALLGGVAKTLAESSPDLGQIKPETYTTNFGLYITDAFIGDKTVPVGGIAFLSSFGASKNGATGDPLGASHLDLAALTSTRTGAISTAFITSAKSDLRGAGLINPDKGVTICVKSGSTKQFAIITVGAGRQPSSVKSEIFEASEWSGSKCNA